MKNLKIIRQNEPIPITKKEEYDTMCAYFEYGYLDYIFIQDRIDESAEDGKHE